MKHTFIIIYVISFSTISHYCYGQDQKVTTPPKLSFHYESAYKITEENGVQVYRVKNNNNPLAGYIQFMCIVGDEGFSSEGLFLNGKRHKKWLFEVCNDATRYEINYNRGILHGYFKVYTPLNSKADTIFYETTFTNGTGIWKDFYGNGDIKAMGAYKSNKKDGEWFLYTKGNNLYRKIYYENGIDKAIMDVGPKPQKY